MPYCRFNHGKMLMTRGKFSKRDGGKRQYYHCRNSYCGYTALEPRLDAKYLRENEPEKYAFIYD
jgi:hypothetical protein